MNENTYYNSDQNYYTGYVHIQIKLILPLDRIIKIPFFEKNFKQ